MAHDRITHETIEEERYELSAPASYHFASSRREFVQVLGAGLVITLSAADAIAQQPRRRFGRSGRGSESEKLADRIHLGDDGIVTVLTGKAEVGQGSRTQICQAVAEDLGVPIDSVRVVMGDTELCPNDGGTSGSRTTPSTVPSVRAAAAAVKEILLELAAAELEAKAESLEVAGGRIVDPESNRSLSFAELAKLDVLASRLDAAVNGDVTLARVERWEVLGTSPTKTGAMHIVTGAHRYPSDVTRPDMLFGRVLRPPSYGARLESVDLSPAEAMDGVTVVRDGDFVGCAAPSSWLAAKAVEAIAETARWEEPDLAEQPTSETLYRYLKEHATSGRSGFRDRSGLTRGAVDLAMAAAKEKLSAAFEIAYIQHAPMEPRAAVAEWQDGKLTVWTGTQNPMRVRGELMEAFRLPGERVRVIVPDTGGGFGGKHTGEVSLEAARLAKASRRPVSLRWTREEEFTWAYFRPAGLIEVTAALDDRGRLFAWEFTNYNSGGSALQTPYEVPNTRERSISCDAPLRSGSYRALASTANTFARECVMDELAAAAGSDPLEFRLTHLEPGRLRDVLVSATEKFGWKDRPSKRQNNRGIGLACGTEKGSYTAACVEVEVDPSTGRIKVLEVCQAFECGAIQNPENLRAQVEGCIIMGLGGALSERIEFAEGRIRNPSFSSYAVPRMDDVPPIDTVLVNRRDLPSVGAGETPIIAIAPAIANAAYRASGVRVRAMPIPADLLKQA